MSEPGEEITAPPETPEPPSAVERSRVGAPVLIAAAAAAAIVIGALAATPFWAPSIMQILPWGAPVAQPQPAAPATPDLAMAALKTQVSQNAAMLQQLGQRLATLEAKAPPPPPDLWPIQQHLAVLDKSIADLTQSVAALDKTAAARPAADPKNTAIALVLLQIHDAIDIGHPFSAEYQALVALAHGDTDITAAAAPLAGPAASGVASRSVLAERLRQLAPQIATAKPPPKPGWKSQIVAQLRSLVTIRRIEGGEQTPAETAVSSARQAMASGDLAGAVDALDRLDGASRETAQPWLQMAKQRLAVETALRQVETALATALGNAAPAAGKG
jgi:hypothetical protein